MSFTENLKAEQFASERTGRGVGFDDPEFTAWCEFYLVEGENAELYQYAGTYKSDQDFIADEATLQGCPDWVMIDYDRTAIGFFQGIESVQTPYGKAYFR